MERVTPIQFDTRLTWYYLNMSDNKFDNLYAGFEHRIIPLFYYVWDILPSVYTVHDRVDVSLLPILDHYDSFIRMSHWWSRQEIFYLLCLRTMLCNYISINVAWTETSALYVAETVLHVTCAMDTLL